jgi:two-component system, NtrC family, sensor kinase
VRNFPNKMTLGAGLVLLVLLGAGFTLGIYSLKTMRDVVSDQFNKQQLVLAEQAVRQIEDQLKIIQQELAILNQSPAVQTLEKGGWANRIRITLAVVRKLGVIEIGRVDGGGNTVYSVDVNERAQVLPRGPRHPKEVHSWSGLPENRGRIRLIKESLAAGPTPGRPLLMLAFPAYRETVDRPRSGPTFAGYLYGLVDREQLVSQVVKGIRSGASGYGWAIDDQGNFIYHPLPEFVGRNAFTVREQKGVPVSFEQINAIQRYKMLQGERGMSWYYSGWHRGLKGNIKKLIAYAPVRMELSPAALNWSVAVVAPIAEVDEAIQMVYTRQLLMEGFILLAILLGGFLLLSFQMERSRVLKAEVEEKTRDWLQSENRYSKLVESAQDLIFTLDREGRIFSLNRYGVDFLEGRLLAMDFTEAQSPGVREASGDHFLHHSLFEYLEPGDSFHPGLIQEVWESGRPRGLEHRVRLGSKECWLSTQLLAIKDDRGRTQAVLGISRDITVRKKMETEMIKTEKLASLGLLSASIAHEINSPLGIILGYCDYLLDKTPPGSETHQMLQKMERQGERCKKIIDHLLGLARYPESRPEGTDLNENLENVLVVAAKALVNNKIDLQKDFAPNLPAVKVEPIPLQQVFLNLINNAISAMPAGGRLTIETRGDVFKDRVVVRIGDSGSGIKKEHREVVFEPFFTTKKEGEGTGLGLSVCDNIINRYGGTINLESKTDEEDREGHGTTFVITFPVHHVQKPIRPQ